MGTKTLRVWELAFVGWLLLKTLIRKLFIWSGDILLPLLMSLVNVHHKGKFTKAPQAGLLR